MAFDSTNFRRVSGSPGSAVFTYHTTDAETATDDSGYFDDAVTYYNLDTGDIIMCVFDTDGTIGLRDYVATNTTGTVTVTDAT